ncbi:hypothetical protein ACQKGD_28175 [Peribacillus frigoritolerans]|uniref:hypothetical protein n=1 Tax=Peribacillus frigoritolerans TaxID=450367 RepID=UPI0007BEBA93|nr:hypothetical protein [Peribacillus frigoritolerans]USK65644.1 hypothetical protein LIT26_02900 [Peribacillus frigoritolerans]
MKTTQKKSDLDAVLEELEKNEQMESLYYLVHKLPEFTSAIQSMEEKLIFIRNVIGDKESLNSLGQNIEGKVAKLHLNQEHFDAMFEIVHLLPQLVSMMKKIEGFSMFMNNILADSTSVEYVMNGLNEIVPLEKGIDIVKETNKRFNEDKSPTNLSLLGMYRLLKDPTVQKSFKYIETLLDVINKK